MFRHPYPLDGLSPDSFSLDADVVSVSFDVHCVELFVCYWLFA
jgi:hypothetical protein